MSGWGSVLAQGILGGVMGGAQAAGRNALEEMKAEQERLKEQRLSALRIQEHAANREADAKVVADTKKREEGEVVQAYKDTILPDSVVPAKTVRQGDEIDAGNATAETKSADREEQARYRLEKFRTSKPGLINQAYTELKDIRSEKEQERKTKADETKGEALAARERNRERELDIKDRVAADRERKTDAQIAALFKKQGDGEGKEPAKIKEVRAIAEMAFGGDIEKAVAFVYGVQDKPRTEAVLRVAAILKGSDADTGKPAELMAAAEKMVDGLRAKETGSRGGATPGAAKDAPKATAAPSTPKNKAEFDALPSGALWVNPKDGKTYRKP